MGPIKQINIKNQTYYFYSDIMDLKTFDSNNLKLDKKTYKDLDIYKIGYATIKKIGHGYDIKSVNPIYLLIGNASGYIKEINKDKYLVFDDTDEIKTSYDDVFNRIIDKIKQIDDNWLEYSKGYKKNSIQFR